MQTFVPYGYDLEANAAVLDRSRLGKQRVEAFQILKALTLPDYGWKNHPATKMWQGFTSALALYGRVMCDEWIARGYKDTMRERFIEVIGDAEEIDAPLWLLREDVMLSHRSNLIRKLPEHYGPIWPNVDPSLAYVWPE